MKQYIRATILSMAQSEILEIVPKDTIDRIKQSDPTPEFRVYCVGHEGEANPQLLTFGQKISMALNYAKDMVVQIANKLQFGCPIFHCHAGANTSEGREQIGEVVGKAVRNIGDRISALAAVYLYPQYRTMPLDVASIESINVFVPREGNAADVIDVEQVTGIALASSATEKPAFPGATLLGAIQALKGAETMRTKEEIKAAIKEGNFSVTDIFDAEDIVDSEPAQKAKTKEREYGKRIEKSLGEEREKVIDLTNKLNEQSGKVRTLTERVNSASSRQLIDTSITTRKLDAKEKAFVEKNAGNFKSEKEGEDLKQDVERFIDAQLKEFVEYAKIMGIDPKKPGDTPPTGAPATDGQGNATAADELQDPSKNDFIPKP